MTMVVMVMLSNSPRKVMALGATHNGRCLANHHQNICVTIDTIIIVIIVIHITVCISQYDDM